MVYNIQNYWDFGRPSPGILKTKDRKVSETRTKSKSETKSKSPVFLTL
jgi:hypothetical protein